MIKFEAQIEPVGEKIWKIVLGKHYGSKCIVRDILQSAEEKEIIIEVNKEIK